MEALKIQLKKLICETLSLQDVEPSAISDDAPLFGEGLGLDSVDALELAMELEKQFGVKLSSDEEGRAALESINTLAAFLGAQTAAFSGADA